MRSEYKLWYEYRQIINSGETDPWTESRVEYYGLNSDQIKIHNANPKPQIAIVIPSYNEQFLLPRTLASINYALSKMSSNCEVIVVDNNSNDATSEIAREFGVKTIKEPKKGIGNARQTGLESVTSTVLNVMTTDSDTVVPGNWIKGHSDNLTDPSVEFSVGDRKIVNDVPSTIKSSLGLFVYSKAAEFVRMTKYCLRRFSAYGNSSAFRYKDALQVGGYNRELNFAEDTDLLYKIVKNGHVAYSKKFTVLTSGRRVNNKGLISHGIDRLKYNFRHIFSNEVETEYRYEDFRS